MKAQGYRPLFLCMWPGVSSSDHRGEGGGVPLTSFFPEAVGVLHFVLATICRNVSHLYIRSLTCSCSNNKDYLKVQCPPNLVGKRLRIRYN